MGIKEEKERSEKKKKTYPMDFEQLKNPKHNIIDVTEAGSLTLLGMMQAPRPVDGDVRIPAVDLDSGADGAAGGGLAEVKEAVKDGAVLADVEALKLAAMVGSVPLHLGRDGGKEFDIVGGVEAADVVRGGGEGAMDLHEAV